MLVNLLCSGWGPVAAVKLNQDGLEEFTITSAELAQVRFVPGGNRQPKSGQDQLKAPSKSTVAITK